MGRPQRVESTGGWFHVMNRGAARRQIFFSRGDGDHFLSLVATACERFGIEVHAYCLMTNHYHLLVRCPEGELSAFMHLVGSKYARHLNLRLGHDGPIFRGRFRAIRLDTPTYIDRVGRYIHRNPVDIRPPVELDRYPWSSLRHYVRCESPLAWLRMDMLLGEHRGPLGYRDYVLGDEENDTDPMWQWAIDTAIGELVDDVHLGSHLRRTIALAMLDMADDRLNAAIESSMAFPSATARAKALHRMRQRLEVEPLISEVAVRALTLAG